MKLKLKSKYTITILIVGLIFYSCQGQISVKTDVTDTMFKDQMDQFIGRVMDSLNIKFGVGLAVVKGEDMVYEGYYGIPKNLPHIE